MLLTRVQVFAAAVCRHLDSGQGERCHPQTRKWSFLASVAERSSSVTGLSRPKGAGEAARGGTCIEDRTVLVPAPSTGVLACCAYLQTR